MSQEDSTSQQQTPTREGDGTGDGELLPCPFCGDAHPERFSYMEAGTAGFTVECCNCGVSTKECDSRGHADAVWNRRPDARPNVESVPGVPGDTALERLKAINEQMERERPKEKPVPAYQSLEHPAYQPPPLPANERAKIDLNLIDSLESRLASVTGERDALEKALKFDGITHNELVKQLADAERRIMQLESERIEAQEKRDAALSEVKKLRLRLLSAAGDDLCRLSQEEIADGPGVLSNCLTLAQLIAENEQLRAELAKYDQPPRIGPGQDEI